MVPSPFARFLAGIRRSSVISARVGAAALLAVAPPPLSGLFCGPPPFPPPSPPRGGPGAPPPLLVPPPRALVQSPPIPVPVRALRAGGGADPLLEAARRGRHYCFPAH